MSVEQIVKEHWAAFGRNYYSRYDYENLPDAHGDLIFKQLEGQFAQFVQDHPGGSVTNFSYDDPFDKSTTSNQGLIFTYPDGSRFVFRKSGTGTVGVTIRIYLEAYRTDNITLTTEEALKQIATDALGYSKTALITGIPRPPIIT